MYKDKNKQREAQRDWVRQKRIDKKGSTKQGSTAPPVQCGVMTNTVDPPKRGKDIKCFADLPPDVQKSICNGESYAPCAEVSVVTGKPGDADCQDIQEIAEKAIDKTIRGAIH